MSETRKEETARLLRERDWWRALGDAYGCSLHGWSGMPPNCSASFLNPSATNVTPIPGWLAAKMYDMARLAGKIN